MAEETAKKPLPKKYIAIIVACVVVVVVLIAAVLGVWGGGSGGSDEAHALGKQAIALAESYLDGEVEAADAAEQMDALADEAFSLQADTGDETDIYVYYYINSLYVNLDEGGDEADVQENLELLEETLDQG